MVHSPDGITVVNTPGKTTLFLAESHYTPKVAPNPDQSEANTHAIAFPVCNFHCGFCGVMNLRPGVTQKDFPVCDTEVFTSKVRAMADGSGGCNRFKFTGGEPSLINNLARLLGVVKEIGGTVYLDTNGSVPGKIVQLVKAGLVDVLAVSLKGLSPDEAMATSGVNSEKLVWRNPLKTISECVRLGVKLIMTVTLVVSDGDGIDRLVRFADVLQSTTGDLQPSPTKVVLKINNFQPNKDCVLSPLPPDQLLTLAGQLVELRPRWKGNTVVVKDERGIRDSSSVVNF